jgi:hypothetical protein
MGKGKKGGRLMKSKGLAAMNEMRNINVKSYPTKK